MSELINKRFEAQRAQLDEIVKDLHDLTVRIGHEDIARMVSELRNRLHEPFMFVIVGEVKAGKSSFVNALLATGKEVTKVAVQPMTDTIQQIVYGEVEENVAINPYLRRISLPVEILREIAIVDTPGTNTIVEHHQEITESFIPASDLIVFVFEAKNPYRQSAWSFFDYIHTDWRKKVIFVLQQKDLMPLEDLEVNMKGVHEQAAKKGLERALVFAVSAKMEQEGDAQGSGFGLIRDYIQANITGGRAPGLKLKNSITTCQGIGERIADGLSLRRRQYEADTVFRKDITETLSQQATKSNKQVDIMVENLLAGYDRSTRSKAAELAEGLSFFSLLRRSFSSMFSKNASVKDWLEGLAKDMEADLNGTLKAKLSDGVLDLADSIQSMAKMIDLKIRNSETILKDDHELFSQIAERRSHVLRDLQDTFADFVNRTDNFRDDTLFPEKQGLSPNLATGGGVAAIGVILMAVTNGMVFDITGGILTAVGLLFAGVSTSVKRRKIISGFETEIAKGRQQLDSEVSERLKAYIAGLQRRIEGNFGRFDELLEREGKTLTVLEVEYAQVSGRLSALEAEVVV